MLASTNCWKECSELLPADPILVLLVEPGQHLNHLLLLDSSSEKARELDIMAACQTNLLMMNIQSSIVILAFASCFGFTFTDLNTEMS